MLERTQHHNGVVTYQSPLLRALGVVHAFSTRIGGISKPPYDKLNLGPLDKGDDSDANTSVAENFRRLRAALDIPKAMRFDVRQVHGRAVWPAPPAPVRPCLVPCADAIVTAHPNQMLTIRTADCVPVLLSSSDGSVVAAAHAGWRGIVAGVLNSTLDTLRLEHGVQPADLTAAIGPHISAANFEVDEEVAAEFEQAGLAAAVVREGYPKPHVDLQQAALTQLAAAGVPLERIDTTDQCTYANAEEFFSYRRGHPTGRMAAVILVRR